MTKGHQNRVDTQATVGSTTISISGESIHNSRDAHTCAVLLAEVLDALKYKGEHKVVASMQRLKGSSSLQGLSTKCVSINAVQLGYQPNGNDSRATYTLQLSTAEEAQKCFVVLKEYLGTAYNGKIEPKAKLSSLEEPVALEIEEPSSEGGAKQKSVSTFIKPLEKPEVYYIKDSEWMEMLILLLSDIADNHPEHQVTKDQVLDLIVARTHLKNRGGTAPIYLALFTRGYLLKIEGVEHIFRLVEIPPVGFKSHGLWQHKNKPAKATTVISQKASKRGPGKNQKYFSDEEWMRSFMDGLRALVTASDGLISKTDLYRFIKDRTNQNKTAGMVYKIVDGLQVRGILITAGEKLYRVVYEPKSDTLEKAVEGIRQARAEVAQVFDGFAKYRLPKFAEGMFANPQILKGFLRVLNEDTIPSAVLQQHIENLFPGFYRSSYFQLFNYLVTHGYLLRPKMGTYSLGPKGRDELGLPAIEYKLVEKAAPKETLALPPVPDITLCPEEVPAAKPQTFLPQAQPAPPLPNTALTGQIALIISETLKTKAEADQSDQREGNLRVRRDDLQALLENPVDEAAVEVEVQRQLIALLD